MTVWCRRLFDLSYPSSDDEFVVFSGFFEVLGVNRIMAPREAAKSAKQAETVLQAKSIPTPSSRIPCLLIKSGLRNTLQYIKIEYHQIGLGKSYIIFFWSKGM